ncbi:hypothetical protein EGW08_009635 [Elysia chlorotica]|uniref:EF-hand domain-containing protein n=1 Tax=Elysia chlorotica TaxID=188477 RepID=A0A3S1BK10_ELYCH|nr:hypothetical protein EGW08_009635 [Elysia chlorotica]
MELDVSKIKRTQPLALKTKLADRSEASSQKQNRLEFNNKPSPGTDKNQKSAQKAEPSGWSREETNLGKRPETPVGRSREAPLVFSSASSGEASQSPPDHIPLIVCDEVNKGDSPPQTRGLDRGVSADNLLLHCPEPDDVGATITKNEVLISNFDNQSQRHRNIKDYAPSPVIIQKSPRADDDSERISSARSRKGSVYGQGSPKKQGESYVERLAKSRVRNSASLKSKEQQKVIRDDISEADDIYYAKFLEQQSYAKRGLWNSNNLSKRVSQLHSTLADLVSNDIRQSPYRSISFTSTPLSLSDNKILRKVFSPAEDAEVNDADFDSDGEEKSKSGTNYAGLNTQDIKAVCVALLSHSAITRLDLSGNELSHQAVQYICELIEENIFITHLKNSNLRELRLSYCDIDEEGGFILSKALEETALEVLDLSWNHLRQRGATAFCMALANNDSIRELDLSWNGLGLEGCVGLEEALAKNKYIVQLNLECNRISSDSLGHLLKGLEKNSCLETLILPTNPLSADDAKLIAASLKAATKSAIKVVDIFDVTVDDDFVAMQEELEERGISIYYGNILQRPKKEIKAGPRTLGSFDPILVLFEYMKQQNLRLIDLFRSLDVNRDNAISREELRNGFMSLNMHLPEGVFSAAFTKLDLNSNNFIDIDELKNAHRRVIRQTALMMLRSQRQDKQKEQEAGESNRFDLLHEFQKLVKDATAKRKTIKLKDESDDEAGGDHAGRRISVRPTVMRKTSALIPGSPRIRRPSSGAALWSAAQGHQNSDL